MLHIYKASAGSGKTFTLAAQYIANLLRADGVPHRSILAVTFTNKATAEMKTRILQQLYTVGYGTLSDDNFFMAVKEQLTAWGIKSADEALRSRARAALERILCQYDDFQVTTIDTFFQHLLASLTLELGLKAGVKADLNDRDVLSVAVARMMEVAEADADVRAWIERMMWERLDNDKDWRITDGLRKLGGELLQEKFLLHDATFSAMSLTNDTVGRYLGVLRQEQQKVLTALKDLAACVDEAVESVGGYEVLSYGTSSLRPYIHTFTGLLRDFSDKIGTRVQGYVEDSDKLRKKTTDADAATTVHAPLVRLVEAHRRAITTLNTIALSTKWLPQLRLLRGIKEKLQDINAEQNHFMLAYTPLLFHQMVKQADALFVFERAGTQFQNIMIDEFQDTSFLQWSNMSTLIAHNIAQGNNCLLVGDVKQGIYRFRGGEWSLLQHLSAVEDDQRKVDTLGHNFRSRSVIVGFNNRLFPQASALLDERETGQPKGDISSIYGDTAQDAPRGAGGRVRLTLYKEDKQAEDDGYQIEADILAQVRTLHEQEQVAYSQMAILVRRKHDIDLLTAYFAEHAPDINFVSDELFELKASPAVTTIVQAMRFLSNTHNVIARQFLMAQCASRESGLPKAFVALAGGAYRRYTLPRLVWHLIDIFHLQDDERQAAYLFSFIDEVYHFLDEGENDVTAFLKEWEAVISRRTITPAPVEGIRVLTIHKAKGLAFHTVILPCAMWKLFEAPSLMEKKPFIWCPTLREDGTSRLPIETSWAPALLPVPLEKEMADSAFAEEYRKEKHDQYIENLNLLYVACTRAERNLLIWGKCGSNDASDSFTVADLMRQVMANEDNLSPMTSEETDHGKYHLCTCSWQDDAYTASIIVHEKPVFDPVRNPLRPSEEQEERLCLYRTRRKPPVIMTRAIDEDDAALIL